MVLDIGGKGSIFTAARMKVKLGPARRPVTNHSRTFRLAAPLNAFRAGGALRRR